MFFLVICLPWVLAQPAGSSVVVLSSCGLRASVVAGTWISCSMAGGIFVPQPGIEPMSPALQGRFLTTGPPGKSPAWLH